MCVGFFLYKKTTFYRQIAHKDHSTYFAFSATYRCFVTTRSKGLKDNKIIGFLRHAMKYSTSILEIDLERTMHCIHTHTRYCSSIHEQQPTTSSKAKGHQPKMGHTHALIVTMTCHVLSCGAHTLLC